MLYACALCCALYSVPVPVPVSGLCALFLHFVPVLCACACVLGSVLCSCTLRLHYVPVLSRHLVPAQYRHIVFSTFFYLVTSPIMGLPPIGDFSKYKIQDTRYCVLVLWALFLQYAPVFYTVC